jgi:hypothetical protein
MSVIVSFVLLSEEVKPQNSDIRDFLAKNWKDLSPATDFSEEDSTLMFDIGPAKVALLRMAAPFPWSDLEGPCATSLLWPEAEASLRHHGAHIIVSVLGDLAPLEQATLLTQVTAAVMHACQTALGVYWGSATLIIPKPLFTDFALEVMAHELPLHIWVDFRVGKDEKGGSSGFTAGMASLGHMEIEALNTPETPAALRDRLTNLCTYLLQNGPVIHDGNTIGANADEKISVVYADSQFGSEGKVMLLEYAASAPKKSKWKLWG